jgi:hypothetical protein
MISAPSIQTPNLQYLLLRDRILERIARRQRPERRLLGLLAAAVQLDDRDLMDASINQAQLWAEQTPAEASRKAGLLIQMTTLLARARLPEYALRLAPLIPNAPGLGQVLVFTSEEPKQCFCWRVTPAYALVHSRSPISFPVEPLVQPYREGLVTIDHAYLKRVLRPQQHMRPILLMPHPLGLIKLRGERYLILDGNHRVVNAWMQKRWRIRGFMLTKQEASAVMVSHSVWPPYPTQVHSLFRRFRL